MKSHLKYTSVFKMGGAGTVSFLAVVALTVPATFLASFPAPAAAAASLALQCQVSAGNTGEAITCAPTIPPVASGSLTCQSPNAISNNNGVYTVVSATCFGSGLVAGGNLSGTTNANVLTIDSNTGSIMAGYGSGTLTYSLGISSETVSCNGSSFSGTLSPLAANTFYTNCTIKVGVLGIGVTQIAVQSGSLSVTTSPNLLLSFNSPSFAVTTPVPGLIAYVPCGTTATIDLSQIVPIKLPLASCSGP